MLEKLKNLFRSDEFIPSASVFPNIDMKRIAKDLKLEEEGIARGQATQPETKAKTLVKRGAIMGHRSGCASQL